MSNANRSKVRNIIADVLGAACVLGAVIALSVFFAKYMEEADARALDGGESAAQPVAAVQSQQ